MNKQNLDNLIDGKNSVDKVSENVDRDVLMKRMFKLMMEAERTTFLGYGSGNSRNGSYERDLLTTMGNRGLDAQSTWYNLQTLYEQGWK